MPALGKRVDSPDYRGITRTAVAVSPDYRLLMRAGS